MVSRWSFFQFFDVFESVQKGHKRSQKCLKWRFGGFLSRVSGVSWLLPPVAFFCGVRRCSASWLLVLMALGVAFRSQKCLKCAESGFFLHGSCVHEYPTVEIHYETNGKVANMVWRWATVRKTSRANQVWLLSNFFIQRSNFVLYESATVGQTTRADKVWF